MEHLVPVIIIISGAFLGEAIFGFGGGLAAIPLLSLFLGVQDAVTLVLIFQLCMGLLIFKIHRPVDWNAAAPISLGLAIGTIAGTLLLAEANTRFLQLFLAAAILLFLVKMIFLSDLKIKNIHNKIMTTLTGLTGGLFQGSIGTGGPVLTMYLSVALPEKARLRATLIYLLFATSLVRMTISVPQQLVTPQLLKLAIITFPFFLVAIMAGQFLNDKIKQDYYQAAIYAILLISAVLLLFKAFN